MFTKLKSMYRRLPSLSPRFHIAFGLSSLLTAVVLLAMFFGFVPDRAGAQLEGRVALAEAVSSTNSVLLKRGDIPGMRGSVEFIVNRTKDLNAVELQRFADDSRVFFGFDEGSEELDYYTSRSADVSGKLSSFDTGSIITVPLLRGNQEWGQLHFQFAVPKKQTFLEKARNTTFSLMAFIGLVSFPLFYFYLGKMLKELNPSTAVPARVRSALDTIAESLLVIDGRGNIVLANAAFAELNGREAEDLLGQKADSLAWIQDDEDNPIYPWEKAFETAEPTRMDMVGYEDKTGDARKFIVNCSPVMGAKDKVGGVLISMDDVTLLEEKELLLRQSMEEAEAANHAKTAFLSNMSHEIRTPMTAILGFTEVLKRNSNQSEEERLRHLSTISNSGTHLLELINDVLDLSKVESGAMDVESIPCKAAYISNEVAHVLKVKAQEKGIDLTIDVASALPKYIYSDPSRLRQIVTNLVGNAIKFTESGGVTVRMDYVEDTSDPRMQIAISDTGIGMTEAQLSTIFEAFIQADASITRRFGGTGLGLSISRKLALAMQGDIIVTSVEGKGSTFMLTVPTGDIAGVPMLSIDEVYSSFSDVDDVSAKTWVFTDSKALVVDDGPENRELLSLVLGDVGIDVETAENGLLGLEAATAGNFDVVLMDIQMPVMDGYQAVAAMREAGIKKPIVALTANAMKGFEQKVLEAGFSHYMTKPIDLDALNELLAKLLDGESVESKSNGANGAPTSSGNSVDVNQESPLVNNGPIFSSMASQNPKFGKIARQFVERLTTRIETIQECLQEERFTELAEHGHWLKGSGGTVGFAEFAEPAKQLEFAAKAEDAAQCEQATAQIRGILGRIEFAEPGVGLLDVTSGTSSHINMQANVSQTSELTRELPKAAPVVSSDASTVDNDTSVDSDCGPIISSLPMGSERFRGIVERFLPRMDSQLGEMRVALEEQNFEELSKLAHWLKGSGGSVGFNGFTNIAASLQSYADDSNIELCDKALDEIEKYSKRVHQGWDTLDELKKSA